MSVEITDGFRVVIEDDYDLVSDFLRWQIDAGIHSFRGSVSGRGMSIDWFPMEYKERVTQWLESTRSKST